MAERLDGVNLRIGIPDASVANVITAFGLDACEASESAIHLLENHSGLPTQQANRSATAWLQRSRSRSQVIVQLRPTRRARLGQPWAGFHAEHGHRLRITEEWGPAQRILVATLTAPFGPGEPAAVPALAPVTARPARGLLSATQLAFLADCAGLTVREDRLIMIGAIRERTWTLRRDDLDLRVRRWTAHRHGKARSLDLADLEVPTSPVDAPFLFPALRSLAIRHLIDADAAAGPMPGRALEWASGRR
jgi:hypothetical protein